MNEERIDERLAAVERAVTDGDPLPELVAAAESVEGAAERERRLEDLDERVAELEAATQALRGYLGEVRATDDDVRADADAALAAVEDLEQRVAALESSSDPDGDAAATSSDPGQTPAAPPRSPDEDPAWLARADERLPAEGVSAGDSTDDDADDPGLAERLGSLL